LAELPSSELLLRAADERRRLHHTVAELRSRVRQELDPKKQVRDNLGIACGIAAALGLALGYSVAGLFVRA